jgi:hypothetical protein
LGTYHTLLGLTLIPDYITLPTATPIFSKSDLPEKTGVPFHSDLPATIAVDAHNQTAITPTNLYEGKNLENQLIVLKVTAGIQKTLAEDILYEAKRKGLQPTLLFAMVEVLSNFDIDKKNRNGNIGLLQLSPVIAEKFDINKDSLFVAKQNLRLGASIFRVYLDRSNGDIEVALREFFNVASPHKDVDAKISQVLAKAQLLDKMLE